MAEDKTKVTFEITREEALVFFDLLARLNEEESGTTLIGEAEKRVLWNLEAFLEGQLTETLSPQYDLLLNKAREHVLAAN